MTIIHIVSFRLSSPTHLSDISKGFLALVQECTHSDTGKPYILGAKGGKQNSPEGRDKGMQVVFVMEFASEKDREYYLDHDPIHAAFKAKAMGEWGAIDAVILDFTEGVF